jgi:hypothetical protein
MHSGREISHWSISIILPDVDEEVRKLMLDREAWRSRIKMIVANNTKEVNSSTREDRKIRCIKTRSAIVVI